MIPILESGAPLTPNTDKAPVVATTAADAGSGATFGQILSAAEQSPPTRAVEQVLADASAGDGKVLHPGGKDLPLDSSVLGEAVASVVFDQQLLAPTQSTLATVAVVTPLSEQWLETPTTEILLPVTPAANAEVPVPAATLGSLALTQDLPVQQPATPAPLPVIPPGAPVQPAAATVTADAVLPPTTSLPATTTTAATSAATTATATTAAATTAAATTAAVTSATAATATAGPQLAVKTALPAGSPEAVGSKQRPSASLAATPSVVPGSLVSPESIDTAAARLQAVLPLATAAATEFDPKAARPAFEPLVTPDVAGRRVLAAATESTAPGVRADLPVGRQMEQTPEKMMAEQLLARSPLESASAAIGTESNRTASPAAVQSPLVSGAMAPASANTTLSLDPRISMGGVLVSVAGEAGWNHEVAQRISVMFRGGVQEAKLQLNPPELGRLDVKITTEGDQARVLFTVQGADTRELIEQALPRLRELLEESGLSLSRFDVADQPGSRRDSGGDSETASGIAESDEDASREQVAPAQQLNETRSLVDYYV